MKPILKLVPKPEEAKCPACSQPGKTFLKGIKDYFILKGNSNEFEVSYCESCEIGFSLPFLDEKELAPYYPDTYEPHIKKKGFRAFLQSLKYKMDLQLIRKLSESSGTSVFEVGPGNAELLATLKDNGFSVAGIEPGKAGRECALRNWGICLDEGFAKDLQFKKTYDIVIARYVLEHVNEPKELLEKIFKSGLKQNGTLLIKIPNMNSWEAKTFGRYWCGWDEPRHRVHFTPNGIRKMLSQIGFTQIQISFEVVPVDLPKNLEYWARYGENTNTVAKNFVLATNLMPEPLKLLTAQAIGVILKPLETGRMTITAKRP